MSVRIMYIMLNAPQNVESVLTRLESCLSENSLPIRYAQPSSYSTTLLVLLHCFVIYVTFCTLSDDIVTRLIPALS